MAKARKKKAEVIKQGDLGTESIRQKKNYVVYITQDGVKVTRNTKRFNFDMYYTRGVIDIDQWEAAYKICEYYHRGITPVDAKISNPQNCGSTKNKSSNSDQILFALEYQDKLVKALRALDSREANIINQIVCQQKNIADIARNTRHSGELTQTLRSALTSLAKYFYKKRYRS